jgi:PAS domain-containing protein
VGIYSAVVDILFIYTGVNYDLFPNEIFSRFSFGITFFILTAMINMSRKFIESAKELEETYKKLKISERKYRILVEGTQDWIFTMDRNFIITSANKTFLKENGLKEDALGKMHFLELIYIPVEGSQLLLQVIKSEIEKLINEKKPITLRTFFYDRNMDAPKEYVLRMENISIDNQFEILCKASKSQDDQLIEYFHSEKNKYVLPNNILVAKEMSKGL